MAEKHRWTETETALALSWNGKGGRSLTGIARQIGVHHDVLRKYLRSHGREVPRMMAGNRPTWPAAEDIMLRQMWNSGMPASKIGARLGRTKNSIIGRSHRLGLASRDSPIKPEVYGPLTLHQWRERLGDAAHKERKAKGVSTLPPLSSGLQAPSRPVYRIVTANPPAPSRKFVVGIPLPPIPVPPEPPKPRVYRPSEPSRACCGPIGEPRSPGFRFCDQPLEGHRNYCESHRSIAYVRRQDTHAQAAG